MSSEIVDWMGLSRKDFFVLAPPGENASDHNVYVEGVGYITDHIDDLHPGARHRRDDARHWDEQFSRDAEGFSLSWKPRPGPLELIDSLSVNQTQEGDDGTYTVLNMGAGLGDFTVNLAQLPGVTNVYHVDFSKEANKIAIERARHHRVANKVTFMSSDNHEFLTQYKAEGRQADAIFFYGGFNDNIPGIADIQAIANIATTVLKPGGVLWYVGLRQPFLDGTEDRTAIDILGEYPVKNAVINTAILANDQMRLVKEVVGNRPDNHTLVPGGPRVDHMHVIHRALYIKAIDGETPQIPEFGFSDAIHKDAWENRWNQITEG